MASINISNIFLCLLISSFVMTQELSGKKPRPNPTPNPVPEYDNYSLAVEWQGTVCKSKLCSEDSSSSTSWNLHGLWPDKDDGNHPFFCSQVGTQFETLNKELQADLALYWSGLYSSQAKFLDHEWTKHGTCWRPDFGDVNKMPQDIKSHVTRSRANSQNSADFFRTTVALSKVYSAYKMLEKSGIVPDANKLYATADLEKALIKGLGGNVSRIRLNCFKDESGRSLVQDLMICLDKNYNPMNCLDTRPSNCAANLSYPPTSARKVTTPIY